MKADDQESSAERLIEALDSLREGIQVLGHDWRYLHLNQAAARHGRKPRSELLGRTMLECYPGIEATPLFAALERCMRERRSEQLENEFTYDDGRRAFFELRIEPCPEGLIVLSLDVSERKQGERTMARIEMLRALGQMAVGVAHDLKNILNPLSLDVQILGRRLRDRPEELEIVGEMAAVVRRGIQTIDLLRELSRQSPPEETSEVQVNQIAIEAAKLGRMRATQSAHPIEIRLELGEPPPMRASHGELLSAVLNLLVNAVEALAGAGGLITVRTGRTGEQAWLEVEDDGPGMTPEVEAHAFEPFFTTKGEAGTGLGLAMVYAFAVRSRGSVQLWSEPGKGVRVTLMFPVSD